MAATKIKFSPSINIVRDNDYEFNYLTTPNATSIFTKILNNILTGNKAHVLIGAYGTGKSSFLLAFKQTLGKSFTHFKGHGQLLNSISSYEFVSIVGENASLEEVFAKRYQLGKSYVTNDIIKAIDKEYKSLKKKGIGLAFLIDEFGKFLDYAAKNNPESELYFVQLLSEWVNDTTNEALLIATLHQDFSAYSQHLNRMQRQEWDKVRGRLNDIPFNEPVEQLLLLAAERIDQKFKEKKVDKNFDKLFECIRLAKAFPLKDYFDKDLARKLYPFDILSAALLTLSLQRYGQNERSLFSFIESSDHLGINFFTQEETAVYYAIPQVYDYLLYSYYGALTNGVSSSSQQWSNIRTTLEKIDGLFETADMQADGEKLIKTIGLLNIFSTGAAKLEPQFYINYAKLALGIKNPEEVIRVLTSKLIIRYVRHNFRYTFVGSTDLDIDLAIDDAGKLVEKVTNIVHHLNQYFDFPFIPAKSVFYEKGTPRFFQFKLTEEPIQQIPEGEVDGFINLVFSEYAKASKSIEQISLEEGAIMYGFFGNTAQIRNTLFEIQKVEKVKESNKDDKIAIKALDGVKEHFIRLLNHYVLDSLYSNNDKLVWYAGGKKLTIKSRHAFNQELSKLCNEVYPATPSYKSELVNKTRVSGQVSTARKRLLEKLLTDLDKINLGFTETEFPPEKSIYLTLLRETGIHQINDGIGTLAPPTNKSFAELWKAGERFLQGSKNKDRSVSEFIATLSTKPYKLKQGVIDLWIPIFLLAKQDEFALYEADTYVPEITIDVLELMNKKPSMFAVKAFDVVGIKLELFNRYRVFLSQAENHKPTNKSFIQTINPFLAFYRDLPEYAKNTNRLSKKAINLRKVIATAKDPEKAFFEDFPAAIGYSIAELQNKPKSAESFLKQLQEAVKELRGSYEALVTRLESFLVNEILVTHKNFPAYKIEITDRFKQLKTHLLMPHQKVFYSRIQSELDDRKAWLASIAQSCIGKPLTSITDDDEKVIFEKLKDIFYELDNLSEISKEQINVEAEEIVQLEITSFVQGRNKNLLRIPKAKSKEVNAVIDKITTILSKDKNINIVALTTLLQELINNEQKG